LEGESKEKRTVHIFTFLFLLQARNGEPLSSSLWTTLLTFSASIIIVGGFTGGVTTKFLVNWFTARRTMQIAHVINIISILIITLGTGLSGSYEAFIIGRFLSGYPCGICYGKYRN